MLKKLRLRFSDPEIEQLYVKSQFGDEFFDFTQLTITSIIINIIQLINAIAHKQTVVIFLASIFIVSSAILLYIMKKNFRIINAILLLFQVNLMLFHDLQYLLHFLEWTSQPHQIVCSFISAILHLLTYFQGTEMVMSTVTLLIAFCFQLIFQQLEAISYVSLFILFSGVGVNKFFQQRRKRESFVTQQDNKKWIEVIEKVFPTWVVILKYDKASTMIQMDKANQTFLSEFEIHDDFTFRKTIRNWKVVPEHFVLENLRIKDSDCINYEHTLIHDLTGKCGSRQNRENKSFYAFQQQRVFKITQVHFSSFETHILLHLSEIKENRFEDLNAQIVFRDRLIVSHAAQHLRALASVISLFKQGDVVHRSLARRSNSFYCKSWRPPQSEFKRKKEEEKDMGNQKNNPLDMQKQNSTNTTTTTKTNTNIKFSTTPSNIKLNPSPPSTTTLLRESLFRFNSLLNLRALILINYNIYRYRMDIISVRDVYDLLKSDIGVREFVKQQRRHTKLMIKRSTSQANPDLNVNTVRNDRQKLLQVVLTTLEFLQKYVPLTSLHFQMKQTKKNPQHYKVKFHSPDLEIPLKVQQLINQNWAQSSQNRNRWNVSNHFTRLREMSEKFTQEEDARNAHPEERLSEKHPSLLWNGVPLAQYLLGQIGPFNMYFFKENQVKFFIYQDLEFIIEEINSNEPNPQFKLVSLKD